MMFNEDSRVKNPAILPFLDWDIHIFPKRNC